MDDIKHTVEALKQISDKSLRNDVAKYGIGISDSKYGRAFSCYGITKRLSSIDAELLKDENTAAIPLEVIRDIQTESVIIFRLYVCFVYMRSEALERGLDHVPPNSVLVPFKEFFRKGGSIKTMSQHIRNSLCHGSFTISAGNIEFQDVGWKDCLSKDLLYELCEQIIRLYYIAYEVKGEHGAASRRP
jgi:hypothetical protein